MRHPVRAERDSVTGCVLLWDMRPKARQLIELLTPESAQVLLLDLQGAHIEELVHQLDAANQPEPLTRAEEAAEAARRA